MDPGVSDDVMNELIPLHAAVAAWAARARNAPALIAPGGETLSYGQLQGEIVALRATLRQLGISHEDRIAFTAGWDARSALLLTTVMASAIAVPLAASTPVAELSALLPRVRPSAVIAAPEEPIASAGASLGIPVLALAAAADPFRFSLDGDALAPPAEDRHPQLDDLAVILTTSGTTGRPKLVTRKHRILAIQHANIQRHLRLQPTDYSVQTATFETSLAQVHLSSLLHAGGAMVFPGLLNGAEIRSLMDAYPVTYLHLAPAMLARVVEAGAAEASALPPGFRAFRVSSARLDPAVRQYVESDLGVPVLDAYGSSEAQNLAGEALDLPRRPGMVGPVLVPMRVMEGDAPAVPGEIGDLQVKGDKVFEGYFDDPAATAAAFTPDGWFRTGDRGRIVDGFLALAGREAETINSGGRKIDPLEVEAALHGFPGIREAAAFAVSDPLLGQRVALAVVPDPGAVVNRRALRRHLLERLSPWKAPTTITVLDALPRTANGKIRRAALSSIDSRE